jgi:hypothetical protein
MLAYLFACKIIPGANAMLVNYNASAVKSYKATISLARFSNNMKNALAYYNVGAVVFLVEFKSRRIGSGCGKVRLKG